MVIRKRTAAALILVVASIELSGCFEGHSIYLKCDGTENDYIKGVDMGTYPYSAVVVLQKPHFWSSYKYITSDHFFLMPRLDVEFSGTTYTADTEKIMAGGGVTEFASLNIVSGHMEYERNYTISDIKRLYDFQCKPQKRLDGIN